jgi:hypothetical protein
MAEPQTVGLKGNAEAPPQQTMGGLQMTFEGKETQQLTELLASTNFVEIHQKLDLLEAVTQGCCEKKNTYRIMDDKEQQILTALESSSGCTRCCCAPHHSTMIFINDQSGNTLLSIERQGCQFPIPLKCLGGGCCVCMDCCKDGIAVYNGKVEGDPGEIEAKPIFHLKEAACGGEKFLWPILWVQKDLESEPVGQIRGPFIFGGCSELCMTATWDMDTKDGQRLAEIVHMTPKSCEDVVKEICTDVDKFRINYNSAAGQMDRTTALAGSLLVDYMFFEMDNGMISCKGGNKIDITCCFCNCCGMQVPCKCTLQKDDKGSGGSGDTE